jgi:hypothetical protein
LHNCHQHQQHHHHHHYLKLSYDIDSTTNYVEKSLDQLVTKITTTSVNEEDVINEDIRTKGKSKYRALVLSSLRVT